MPLVRAGHESDLVERYGGLADISSQLGLTSARLWTLALFLAISAPLAALRPAWLIGLLPGLGIALLSAHPPQRALELHYADELVPVAILATTAVASRLTCRPYLAVTAIAAPALIGMALVSPLVPWNATGSAPTPAHRRALDDALALVPRDGSVVVSAQSSVLAHLSQRRQAGEFPGGAFEADWVVVDRYGFISSQSIAAGYETVLAEIRATFTLVFAGDGVEVFRRTP
jgi:hypothetical protein